MQDPEIHPDDAASMRDSERHAGPLRQELSNAIMALYKQYFGKGPITCRAYLEPDMVVLVLDGGYTAAEATLFEAGKWHDVGQSRLNLARQHGGALRRSHRTATVPGSVDAVAGADEAALVGEHDELSAVADRELHHRSVDMRLDRER